MATITLAEINESLKEQTPLLERTASGMDAIKAFVQSTERTRLSDVERSREAARGQGNTNNVSGIGGILAAPGIGVGAALGGLGSLVGSLGPAGAGIGAFFLGLAGAEAIMTKFGNGENLKALLTNLAEGMGAFGTPELLSLGALFTGAALFGTVTGGGKGAGLGIAAVGAGIAAFFVGLSAADNLIGKFGTNGDNLPRLAQNIADSIKPFVADGGVGGAFAGLLATGAIFGALAGTSKKGVKAMAGMSVGTFAIGSALGAFFAGFGAAAAFNDWLAGDADGSKLKRIATNMYDTIAIFKDSTWMTGLLAGGAILGAVGGAAAAPYAALAAGGAVVGTFAVGAALGAFFAGFAAVDAVTAWLAKDADGSTLKKIATNLSESISGFENIDAGKVFAVGNALTSLGGGMFAFFGAEGLHGLQNMWGDIKGAFFDIIDTLFGTSFGEGEKKSAIQYIVDSLEPIKTIDEKQLQGIDAFSAAINGLSGAFTSLANIKAEGITVSLEKMLRGVSAILEMKDALLYGGEYDPRGYNLFGTDIISFGPKGEGGLANFTAEEQDTMRSGIERLYGGLGITLPSGAPSAQNMVVPTVPLTVATPSTSALQSPAMTAESISNQLRDLYVENLNVKNGMTTPAINIVDASTRTGGTNITSTGGRSNTKPTPPQSRGHDFGWYGGGR